MTRSRKKPRENGCYPGVKIRENGGNFGLAIGLGLGTLGCDACRCFIPSYSLPLLKLPHKWSKVSTTLAKGQYSASSLLPRVPSLLHTRCS